MKTSNIVAVGIIFIVLVLAAGGWYIFKMSPSSAVSQGTVPSTPVVIKNPFGVVAAKTADGFTFTSGIEVTTYTVHTTAATEYRMGTSTPKTAADVKVGSLISIASSTVATDGSLNAYEVILIPPPPSPYPPEPTVKN